MFWVILLIIGGIAALVVLGNDNDLENYKTDEEKYRDI